MLNKEEELQKIKKQIEAINFATYEIDKKIVEIRNRVKKTDEELRSLL